MKTKAHARQKFKYITKTEAHFQNYVAVDCQRQPEWRLTCQLKEQRDTVWCNFHMPNDMKYCSDSLVVVYRNLKYQVCSTQICDHLGLVVLWYFSKSYCLPSWYLSKSGNLEIMTFLRQAGNAPKLIEASWNVC